MTPHKCPVCGGKGSVTIKRTIGECCHACKGEGIVWESVNPMNIPTTPEDVEAVRDIVTEQYEQMIDPDAVTMDPKAKEYFENLPKRDFARYFGGCDLPPLEKTHDEVDEHIRKYRKIFGGKNVDWSKVDEHLRSFIALEKHEGKDHMESCGIVGICLRIGDGYIKLEDTELLGRTMRTAIEALRISEPRDIDFNYDFGDYRIREIEPGHFEVVIDKMR